MSPRIRSVHHSICDDQTLANVSAEAERTFVRLWTHLDDEGRAEDRPKLLAARLYPEHDDMDAAAVDRDLRELAENNLLIRYEVKGEPYLCAKPTTWSVYQKPRHPTPSKFPPPPKRVRKPPAKRRNGSEDDGGTSQGVVGGEGGGDVVGGGEGGSAEAELLSSFDEFWNLYPRRDGKRLHRRKAEVIWKRLSRSEREAALVGAKFYGEACSEGLTIAADAFRWLRDKSWRDWQEPATPDIRTKSHDPYAEMAQSFGLLGRGEPNGAGSQTQDDDPPRRGLPA